MVVDPSQMGGVAPAQGLSNTQTMAPAQAGTVPPAPAAMQTPVQQAPPPKPPSLVPTDVARLLAEAINNAKQEAADGLVRYLGNPRGNVNVKIRDMLKVWRKRDPNVDPLYEKLINKKSDDEIMRMMYPARRALIRYSRRTYTDQVEFAEYMDKLDKDPKYADLDAIDEDDPEDYIPPQSKFPSRGEETYRDDVLKEREEEQEPPSEE